MFKKHSVVILIAILAAVLGVGSIWRTRNSVKNIADNITASPVVSSIPVVSNSSAPISTPAIPDNFLIKNVPFQSQAPLGIWDNLHNEACEEASIIIVDYYLNGKSLPSDTMEQEIQKLVQWENDNWGGPPSITADQAGQLAHANYGLNYQVIKNVSIDDLKAQIAAGHPVIVPAAGRLLGNPNFRSPGPAYHMVVAIGYTKNTIIVQDVGTRNGDHYVYNYQIFYNAMHDWVGAEDNIETGPKNILVLVP